MQKYAGSDLIHGHTHRQNIHKNAQYTRYVLGDWRVDKGNVHNSSPCTNI
jgi:UDP-2,3-diacylglucosamine hydrolase